MNYWSIKCLNRLNTPLKKKRKKKNINAPVELNFNKSKCLRWMLYIYITSICLNYVIYIYICMYTSMVFIKTFWTPLMDFLNPKRKTKLTCRIMSCSFWCCRSSSEPFVKVISVLNGMSNWHIFSWIPTQSIFWCSTPLGEKFVILINIFVYI